MYHFDCWIISNYWRHRSTPRDTILFSVIPVPRSCNLLFRYEVGRWLTLSTFWFLSPGVVTMQWARMFKSFDYCIGIYSRLDFSVRRNRSFHVKAFAACANWTISLSRPISDFHLSRSWSWKLPCWFRARIRSVLIQSRWFPYQIEAHPSSWAETKRSFSWIHPAYLFILQAGQQVSHS